MRSLKLDYGSSVVCLPAEKIFKSLDGADMQKMKVLLLLAADEGLRKNYGERRSEITERLDITLSALEKDIEFWTLAGVISVSDDGAEAMAFDNPRAGRENAVSSKNAQEKSEIAAAPSEKTDEESQKKDHSAPRIAVKTPMPSSLPTYTESQCADVINASSDLADVMAMCQQIVGKIFTSADVSVIVTMYDHLGLSGEYIVTLFSYCCGRGKKSLRYIERTALNLFDEGIDNADALNGYIKRKDELEDNLQQIRKLIGAGARELTAKEKKFFSCWLDEWRFSMDVITRAYEITVDKINEPSVSYMNKILENWNNSGLTTIEAVEASLENYKKKKAEASHGVETVNGTETGFQTDEFFEAALRRSYREGASSAVDGN